MTKLDVVATEGCKTAEEVLTPRAATMLTSIQENLGFSSAEDAILRWLEGCSVEGVERLSVTINDYLQNRKEAEMQVDTEA